jgi:hypothetical protein
MTIPETDERPWHQQVTDLLAAFVVALRAHPNAAILVLSRILRSDPGIAVTDRMLALLSTAGFAVEAAAETTSQALCSLVSVVTTEPGRANGSDVDAHDADVRRQKATLSSLDPAATPTSSRLPTGRPGAPTQSAITGVASHDRGRYSRWPGNPRRTSASTVEVRRNQSCATNSPFHDRSSPLTRIASPRHLVEGSTG